jgi:hypothetical protein
MQIGYIMGHMMRHVDRLPYHSDDRPTTEVQPHLQEIPKEQQPERKETGIENKEYWTPEQMEKRHRIATLGVGMEIVARSADPEALERFLEELRYEPIPEHTKQTFAKIATEYQALCRKAQNFVERSNLKDSTPEKMGLNLFVARTGKNR